MRFVLGIIFGVLMLLFILQNMEIVEITFLFWTLSISRALMVFVIFIIGVLSGIILKSLLGKRGKDKPQTPGS
jgi:uncharacterized integral membrane protein